MKTSTENERKDTIPNFGHVACTQILLELYLSDTFKADEDLSIKVKEALSRAKTSRYVNPLLALVQQHEHLLETIIHFLDSSGTHSENVQRLYNVCQATLTFSRRESDKWDSKDISNVGASAETTGK